MGRPLGAQNKHKPFRDALRVEIAAAEQADDKRSVRSIARTLLSKAAEGEGWAIREVADRLDGRPPQAIMGSDDHAPIGMVLGYDLSKLTLEQLTTLRDLIALARTPAADESEMVDVTPSEGGGEDAA